MKTFQAPLTVRSFFDDRICFEFHTKSFDEDSRSAGESKSEPGMVRAGAISSRLKIPSEPRPERLPPGRSVRKTDSSRYEEHEYCQLLVKFTTHRWL
ncbi:MAG: hypothetical protein PUF78_08775 [Lachnospiraceae bacterium]|nr:hypothetical protein [Lachnospiraceae bacterium]MDD6579099.1 hypothetical protein [Lachnospiraceae bacterium]